MLESLYITFAILAFLMIFLSFIVQKDKLAQQITLLGISMGLFAGLAMASANVEVVSCEVQTLNTNTTLINYTNSYGNEVNNTITTYSNNTDCKKTPFFFQENMFIFGFFGLFAGVLFLIKSFDAFFFTKGRL